MSVWAERAKARFSQTCQNPTDKTDEPPLLSVLSVPSQHLCEKTEDAKGTFVGFVSSHLVHPEKIALPASDPDWTPAPPPPDPMLLALADRYCTAIQASNKARADWRSDIEATPPDEREGLAAYLRGQLAKLVPVAPAMPSKAAPTASASSTWQQHDKADQAHYWGCPQCLAVVKTGIGTRCTTGQQLHDAYVEAATREGRFLGAKPDPAKPLPPFHAAQPWRVADKQWLAHWQQCPQCQTAGRTGTARCAQGEALFSTYQQATEAGK